MLFTGGRMYRNLDEEKTIQQQIDEELLKFNWGAFFLNFIWASFNGAWKEFWPTFLIMLLFSILTNIPLFGIVFFILNIILAVYVGRHGNEWAWYGKKWDSLEQFISVQKNWGIASPFVLIFLSIVVPFCITIGTIFIVGPFAKAIIEESELVSKSAVKTIVNAPGYRDFQSGKDVANYFIGKNIYTRYFSIDENMVLVGKKGPYKSVLTFEKSDGYCSLDEKNCYVLYSIVTSLTNSNKLQHVEKTYFDDKGNIKSEKL